MNTPLESLAHLDKDAVTPHSAGFAKRMVIRLLERMPRGGLRMEHADGRVRVFGEAGAPVTARVIVRDDSDFFKRCAFYGNIGMGEAYTDGIWDTDDIAAVISWFIDNMNALQGSDTSSAKLPGVNLLKMVNWLRHLRRSNTVETSRRNIAEHYDLGNDFYQLWLDPTMTYSSARFDSPDQSLEEAQQGKYAALCRKLNLVPGDHVLEIGCGWGGFAAHAAKHHGCRVTGVTISEAQAAYARERIAREGLQDRVEIRIQDYRHIEGGFDKIASIEMLEAVGDKFHDSFFRKCAEVLAPDGLLGLQMITVPDCRYASLKDGVDWIQRHIFPGSLLLSVGRVNEVISKTGDLFMHDLEDLGADYARTLSAWHVNFNAAADRVRALGFDQPFIRTWNYYLKYCEAGFTTRNISVVQAIYTRPNNPAWRTDDRGGARKTPWWRRWIVAPVVGQLTAGITPERLSWTVAAGAVLGIFPVMGTTTLICLLAGWMFKLNQVVLQVFKELVYPLHLVLILVFIRLGERLHGVPEIPFSIPQLLERFKDSPVQFARDFGFAAWHGVVAWLLIAPFALLLIRTVALPVLKRLDRAIRKEARA